MRDSLSWCVDDGRAVFLDLAADRYFRLRPQDDTHFQEWARTGDFVGFDPTALVDAGVLTACHVPQPPRVKTHVPIPSADLGEEPGVRARMIDILHAMAAQRRAARALRRGQLAAMVSAIRDRPLARPARDGDRAARRIAAAFASTPLSFAKSGQCLPRALAAYALCRRSGVAPTLVFGIRLEPFAAHCWLQLGSTVLVGDLEQARLFIPILAVP